MSGSEIKFGTDGWRAIVADTYTYANVARCARAFSEDVIQSHPDIRDKLVVVGYDTRFQSNRFARTVADTVAEYGINVMLFDRPAPTPACSFAVKSQQAVAGVMITASHNPAHWNGFKVKAGYGGTAPQAQIDRIEALIAQPAGLKAASASGKVTTFDPVTGYVNQLRSAFDIAAIRQAELNVIADAMHGSGAGILQRVLLDGADAADKLTLREIRGEPNPAFPDMKQPEPLAHNLVPLQQALASERSSNVGIAFDGDADRLGVMDEHGEYIAAGTAFSLLLHHLLARRGVTQGVSCTVTMSAMVDKLGNHYGVPVYRTPVGFKYVGQVLMSKNCAIGGEESGGYALLEHLPERDGPASALLFLEALAYAKKSPTELLAELFDLVGQHAYYREDLNFDPAQRQSVETNMSSYAPSAVAGMSVANIGREDGLKVSLDGGAWVACRLSGTEPLLRVYAEADSEAVAQQLTEALKSALSL